jgi:hypothetical protein
MPENISPNEKLTAHDWALAIVIAYETKAGLTGEARKELQAAAQDPSFRQELRQELQDAGYRSLFERSLDDPRSKSR